MSRVIDADALRATVMKILNNSIGGAYDGVYQCLEAINNAPTVLHDNYSMGYQDGVRKVLSERPQGEWLEDSGNIACSYCHTIWLYRRTDFCPHCGADMRGGRE